MLRLYNMPPTNPRLNRTTHLNTRVAMYHRLAWSFVILTIALVALIVVSSLNRTTITLTREPQPVSTDFSLPIYDQTPPSPGTFLVGQFFARNLTADLTAYPKSDVLLDDYAAGTVTLTNNTGRDQPLVATTRLLTADNKLFRLTRGVIVPARGTISAPIKADQAGSSYETNGPTKFTIPGLNSALQTNIYATSDALITGGTKPAGVIVETDIAAARNALEEKLRVQAQEAFKPDLAAALTPISGQALAVKLESFTTDFKPKKPSDTLRASANGSALLFAFDATALLEQARVQLQDAVPSHYQLQDINKNSLTYFLDAPQGKDEAKLKVHLEGFALIDPQDTGFDSDTWTDKSLDYMIDHLQNLPGISGSSIKSKAFWTSRLPRDPRAITIRFLP